MSKRRLQTMVKDGIVIGWDDPRIPTINGLRRRGYTPKAINDFVDEVGVTRRGNDKFVSYQLLESFARKDLNSTAKRTMAVLDPLKVTLVNFTETQRLSVPYFPNEPEKGAHEITISSVFYIENSDFRSEASDEFFGLTPGKVVGLKYCPFKVKCLEVLRNEAGQPTELRCEVADSNIKTKGILHWLSIEDAAPAEVRLYNLLFLSENPNSLEKWIDDINPQSLEVKPNALVNRNLLSNLQNEEKFQFERMGYFVVDKDSTPERPVFNRTVTLQEGKKKDV
jgi:glutaminyl-tRNA synthetase